MAPAKETAEEQLLKMIEGPRGSGGAAKPPGVSAPRGWRSSMLDVAHRWQRMLLPGRREADVFLWNLRVAQRVLWIGLAGLGAYVMLDLLWSPSQLNKRLRAFSANTRKISTAATAPSDAMPPLKPLATYVSAVAQRNPFTGAKALTQAQAVRTTRDDLEARAQDLVVVGIDRGAIPVALVEQKSAQRTHMVKVGDEVNGLTVKQISSDGVVVSYEGEELVLP